MKNNIKKGVLRGKILIFTLRTLIKGPAVKILRFSDIEKKIKEQPYLIFANHSDSIDPAYIIKTTKRYVRFVMSDHVMRMGIIGKLYNFIDAPIIFEREKGTDALYKSIVDNIKAGVNVAMYPEGAMTNTGETGFISKRNATLVKECDCTFVTYRGKGGYLKKPRWAKNSRKGPISGEVVNVYSRDQIRAMSEEEIYDHILKDLYVNIYDEQRVNPKEYITEDPAEHAEIILYGCPKCKEIGLLRTKGEKIFCDCGFEATIDSYGFWHSEDMEFDNIVDWDKFQKQLLKEITLKKQNTPESLFKDDKQTIFSICNSETTQLSENGTVHLYGDRVELLTDKETVTIPVNEINSIKTSSKMNLLLVTEKGYFEIKSPYPRSATKYIVAIRYLQGKENK
ncbi:MAG: 1-acyl-sn-glycerol-3-phosphate acyltransferase [Clostridia bacterium]|nr:1-acyl-sn-glycerol-3-phosphate acyltransferase [Clostridia bacterium]